MEGENTGGGKEAREKYFQMNKRVLFSVRNGGSAMQQISTCSPSQRPYLDHRLSDTGQGTQSTIWEPAEPLRPPVEFLSSPEGASQ